MRPGSAPVPQRPLLLGAPQQVVDLVGQGVARRVGGHEGLERPLGVLLQPRGERPGGAEGRAQRRLAHARIADNNDDLSHEEDQTTDCADYTE
jgi:hypothetical protein